MSWKCPECGSPNKNSIIICSCGYEKGMVAAPCLELLQTTFAENTEGKEIMQTVRLPIKKIILDAFLIPFLMIKNKEVSFK